MLTIQQLKDYVMTLNGDQTVSVELEDKDFTICILPKTMEVYNRYRPKVVEFPLTLVNGKQEYNLSRYNVGRGVFDLVPEDRVTDAYRLFPQEYWPHNYPVSNFSSRSPEILQWKVNDVATRKTLGVWDDFHYNRDTNILKVYPEPLSSMQTRIVTLHDRYFNAGEFSEKGNGVKVTFDFTIPDSEGFPIKSIATKSLSIVYKNEKFRDVGDGTLESTVSGSSGTINYSTGAISVTFNTAPLDGDIIQWELCEVYSEDYDWYKDYAIAIGDLILGRKRKKFSQIPGSQAPVDLYVDILSEGSEAKERLEERAMSWATEWMIPRLL
jgi:hypothetical protein